MAQPSISGGTLKTSLTGMNIGDYISCEYTATSGSAGTFANLGSATKTEISTEGTATPNGTFYFIKADKGLLIADRVIQTGVSWATLNGAKYIEGNSSFVADLSILPAMTATTTNGVTITANSTYPNYQPWMAADGNTNEPNSWYFYGDSAINSTGGILTIDLGTSKLVDYIKFSAAYIRQNQYGVGAFTFSGSNDNVTYTTLLSGTHPNAVTLTTYQLTQKGSYRYYQFKITSAYGGGTLSNPSNGGGLLELNLMQSSVSPGKIRSLSGGNSFIDEAGNPSTLNRDLTCYPPNNEWDKYIVKSTLGGKITPGSDNVWNYSKKGLEYLSVSSTSSSITSTSPYVYNFSSPLEIKSLRFIRTGTGDQTMSEIRVWSNGVNIASTSTVTNFGGNFIGAGVSGLFDGNTTNYVWDDTAGGNEYIELTFPNLVTVSKFEVYGNNSYPINGMSVLASVPSNSYTGNHASWTLDTVNSSIYGSSGRVIRGYGNCRAFNGINDRVSFSSVIIPTGNKTISFKMKRLNKPSSTNERIIGAGIGGSDSASIEIALNQVSGGVNLVVFNGANIVYNCSSTTNICDNQWHDILFEQNHSLQQVKLYIDGVLNTTVNYNSGRTDSTNYSRTLIMGAGYLTSAPTYSYFYGGLLDEFKVTNGSGTIILYLPMDEASGNLNDNSGNNYTGTANGTIVTDKVNLYGFTYQVTTTTTVGLAGFRPALEYIE